MANTYIQPERTRTPGSGLDDTLTPTDHDANAVNLLDTLNYIVSQIADITGETAWETAPDASIATIDARTFLDEKKALREQQLLTDITVAASANYKLLVVASSEVPAGAVKAIGATTDGLVTAQHGGTFGTTHDLAEVAGDNAINPKNLLIVVDGSSGDPLLSSGRKIYGLLQHESGGTDGGAITDTTPQRVQVSFVRPNATHDDLEACPVADIENKVINLSFVNRTDLDSWVEQDFLQRSAFVDIGAAAASVTLDNAIDNQGVTPATQATNVRWQIADEVDLDFENGAGDRDLLKLSPAAAGDLVQINADSFDVNVGAAGTIDFDNGVTVDSGGTAINLGVTAGQIDAGAAALTVKSTGAAVTVDGVGVNVLTNAGGFAVNTNQLVVEATSGEVGIGTTTPAVNLEINESAGTNTEYLRLADSVDTAGVFLVNADPNGTVTGARGSIALDYTNGTVWVNTNDVTAWTNLASGGFLTDLEVVAQAAAGTSVTNTAGGLDGDVDLRGVVNQIEISRDSATQATFGVSSTLDIELLRSRANVSNTIDLDTGTNGMQFASDAEFDVDATAGVTVDGTTVALTGTDTTSLTMNANDAAAKTLTVQANNAGAGAGHIALDADDDILFTTTEDTALPLTDATSGSIAALFGGTHASVGAAIQAAGLVHDIKIKVFTVGSNFAQDANVAGAAQDLTAYPIDMQTPATVEQLIFLNGMLLVGGNGTTNNDVYAGDTPASGDLKFDFPQGVKSGDIVLSVVFSRQA